MNLLKLFSIRYNELLLYSSYEAIAVERRLLPESHAGHK